MTSRCGVAVASAAAANRRGQEGGGTADRGAWRHARSGARGRRPQLWRGLRPVQLFAGSFLLLIGLGTLGLRFLPGLYVGAGLGWVDALFTATSAVCVTGLIVVDTATYFTPLGQAFLLVLIQLGGLGIITFTTLIIVGLGRRLSLRSETLMAGTAEIAPHIDSRRLTRHVVKFTLAFEAVGALALYLLWVPRLGWAGAAWNAVFHSISAFCNAGFSTFTDSLVSFDDAPITLIVVMLLIVLGGLGFLTMEELYLGGRAWRRRTRAERHAGDSVHAASRRPLETDDGAGQRGGGRVRPVYALGAVPVAAAAERQRPRLSMHSRLVIATTAVLLLAGWVLFAAFEWRGALGHHGVVSRLVNAMFLSVTPRTAGFNTIDYATASDSTNFLTIIFMFIGGSPGSTAGGLKTTTFALIGLLAWSRLRGEREVSVGGRSVPPETIERAVGLCVVAFGLLTAAVLVLVAAERSGTPGALPGSSFLTYMFEATSAFNTVGLSMGVTGDLSSADRLLTTLLMYIGRVGPLAFAASIALRGPGPAGRFRYAYEDVVVG